MNLLVTGGAGFIGSNFIHNIHNNKIFSEIAFDRIFVLDKLTYASNISNIVRLIDRGVIEFIEGDICDKKIVNEIMKNVDVVINFAAESHVDRSITDSKNFIVTNVLGTTTLLQSALGNQIKTFIQISTDEVYGSISTGSWSESSILDPSSPYSSSKASADLIAMSFYKTYGLDVRVTRCSNNYGKYQFPEKFIPLAITNLIIKKKIPIYGNGANVREWIHVDDHCAGIGKVLEYGKPGEIYNIGSGTELTNLQIAKKIIEIYGESNDPIDFVEDRLGHDLRYSVDFSKIEKIGFESKTTFENGLVSTFDWYKQNRIWWEKVR